MPKQKTKHTHTVQKAYLKNFSKEEDRKFLLWRLDKKTGNKKRLTIENVSVENYFYPQDIEEWLTRDIEGKGIPIINKIIKERIVSSLNSEEKERVARWIIVQDLRTREYRNKIRQGFEETAELIIKKDFIPHKFPDIDSESLKIDMGEDPVKNIQISMMKRFQKYAPIIASNYHWTIVENDTGNFYYTSDHPIIKDNVYLNSMKRVMDKEFLGSGKGYFSKGVELHLPLNPELELVLMNLEPLDDMLREIREIIQKNPQLYPILWRLFPHDKVKQLRKDKWNAINDNIFYMNEHISSSSNRFIYSKKNDFTIAENFLRRKPEYKDEDRKRWIIN